MFFGTNTIRLPDSAWISLGSPNVKESKVLMDYRELIGMNDPYSGLAYNTSHLPDQQLLVEDQAHLSPESDVHILCDRVTLNGAS